MIDTDLLKIMCCPETHQSLSLAEADLVTQLNQKIAASQLRNRAGQILQEKIDGGLLRQDGQFLYPIRNGIPIMLMDESIPIGSNG